MTRLALPARPPPAPSPSPEDQTPADFQVSSLVDAADRLAGPGTLPNILTIPSDVSPTAHSAPPSSLFCCPPSRGGVADVAHPPRAPPRPAVTPPSPGRYSHRHRPWNHAIPCFQLLGHGCRCGPCARVTARVSVSIRTVLAPSSLTSLLSLLSLSRPRRCSCGCARLSVFCTGSGTPAPAPPPVSVSSTVLFPLLSFSALLAFLSRFNHLSCLDNLSCCVLLSSFYLFLHLQLSLFLHLSLRVMFCSKFLSNFQHLSGFQNLFDFELPSVSPPVSLSPPVLTPIPVQLLPLVPL